MQIKIHINAKCCFCLNDFNPFATNGESKYIPTYTLTNQYCLVSIGKADFTSPTNGNGTNPVNVNTIYIPRDHIKTSMTMSINF